MTTAERARALACRARGGYAPADSAALLDEILAAHDGDNRAAALAYHGFTR